MIKQAKFAVGGLRSPAPALDHEMEVLSACDERYLPHAATMLCSLLEHNIVSKIHLFYSLLPSPELAKLKSLVERYGAEILLYEMMPADWAGLRVDRWISIAAYYRILAPRFLPSDIDKILYLDSDIIVRRSLYPLWNTNITDHALAAVANYDEASEALGLDRGTKYFNSGVLLINLRFWRQNNVAERAISFAKNNSDRVQYHDQDALNATLAGHWIELSSCWNAQIKDKWHPFTPGMKNDPAIVHFFTDDKPWLWSNRHPFKHEYRKYRLKTPWWEYRMEEVPGLTRRVGHYLRSFARTVLPRGLRQWLRNSAL